MLGAELLEGGAGGLGHVGSALVDDDLDAFSIVDRLGEAADDQLGVLLVVDDDGLEQRLVTAADVLGGDEIEGNAERLEVGGVGGELGLGQDEIEGEAAALGRASRRGTAGRRGSERWIGGGAGQVRKPGTQRAGREGKTLTEALLCERAVLGRQTQPGTEQQRAHGART